MICFERQKYETDGIHHRKAQHDSGRPSQRLFLRENGVYSNVRERNWSPTLVVCLFQRNSIAKNRLASLGIGGPPRETQKKYGFTRHLRGFGSGNAVKCNLNLMRVRTFGSKKISKRINKKNELISTLLRIAWVSDIGDKASIGLFKSK